MLNALEPETYVPPHRHLDPAKGESIIILRGSVGVLFFAANGEVTDKLKLQPQGEHIGVDIPAGTFHSLVSLEPGSVFFEAKAGPYVPITADELASWAPPEGNAEVSCYLAWMKSHFD